jgi:plastocyanin
MRRHLVSVVSAGALLLALAPACSSSGSKTSSAVPPGAVVVELKNIAFIPATVTIKAGQTVAWKFDDSVAHNVSGEGFRSSDMTTGIFSHTFAKAGDYKYDCTIHAGMNGEVIVQ